jgi:translocation and assembly module TamB
VIVRAGFDLRVVRDSAAPAHISGRVDLGPSFFTSDLVSLIPTGGVAKPEMRPPYFSVSDEPFAGWTLDVALKGEDFLRVETPLFRGRLSADFRLEGTLAEPRAIGRLSSSGSSLLLPFAALPLEQLEITLSADAPYEPAIIATGSTRVFGYDVHMEAMGRAAEPTLLFSSDPPMSSQAVFLMLTTGALPGSSHTIPTMERSKRMAFFLGRGLVAAFGLGSNGGDGASRLTVRSAENFSREGRETIYVEYDLGGRWSVVGEYDRFDAYNGGVKFRILDR